MTTSPSSVTRSAGDTVEFRCDVRGSPPPRIQWVKDGGQLPDQHTVRDGSLVYVTPLQEIIPVNENVEHCLNVFLWSFSCGLMTCESDYISSVVASLLLDQFLVRLQGCVNTEVYGSGSSNLCDTYYHIICTTGKSFGCIANFISRSHDAVFLLKELNSVGFTFLHNNLPLEDALSFCEWPLLSVTLPTNWA